MNSVLTNFEFKKIADIQYRFHCELWWHPQQYFHVSVIKLGRHFIVKATKSYFMVGTTEKGETYARDLPGLHTYLETRMREFHISVYFIRDITPSMASRKIGIEKPDIDGIKSEMDTVQTDIAERAEVLKYTNINKGILQQIQTQQKREFETLKMQGQRASMQNQQIEKLEREYSRKGNATNYFFSYSTNIQYGSSLSEFKDALTMIMAEIDTTHKFEISQRLQGGRLNIFIRESKVPDLALQAEWAGGILNPKQLSLESGELQSLIEKTFMVHPSSDIMIDSHNREHKKYFGAKALQTILMKLDTMEQPQEIPNLPKSGGWMGMVMRGNEVTSVPYFLPRRQMHLLGSGAPGSGKSVTVRVVVENALINGINSLIFDPTLECAGLGLKNTNKKTLSRFDEIGIGREYTRGFPVKIYTPGSDIGLPISDDLSKLFNGISVITTKFLNDKERCELARDILSTALNNFEGWTDIVKQMIVFEECHNILPAGVFDKDAKAVATKVQKLFSRISREKRKYGLQLVIVTHNFSDFKNEGRIVRSMIDGRIILRSKDHAEEPYLKTELSDEQIDSLPNLRTGVAYISIPGFKGIKVYIRPPFSLVKEPTDKQIRQINKQHGYMDKSAGIEKIKKSFNPVKRDLESQIMNLVNEIWDDTKSPIPAKLIQEDLELSTGTRHRVLEKMVKKKLIKKVEIKVGLGRPMTGIKPGNIL